MSEIPPEHLIIGRKKWNKDMVINESKNRGCSIDDILTELAILTHYDGSKEDCRSLENGIHWMKKAIDPTNLTWYELPTMIRFENIFLAWQETAYGTPERVKKMDIVKEKNVMKFNSHHEEILDYMRRACEQQFGSIREREIKRKKELDNHQFELSYTNLEILGSPINDIDDDMESF